MTNNVNQKQKKYIDQRAHGAPFGAPCKKDFDCTERELHYDPNVLPQYNCTHNLDDELRKATKNLEKKWMKSLLFGCNNPSHDQNLQKEISQIQSIFSPVLKSNQPLPNIAENYSRIRYHKSQLERSIFNWDIELLHINPYGSLYSWRDAYRWWDKEKRLKPSGSYYKKKKFYDTEKQYCSFHQLTLYLLSCFAFDRKDENFNPAIISSFLSHEYYKTREMWRAFLTYYNELIKFQQRWDPSLELPSKYTHREHDGYAFFRDGKSNILLNKAYMLFQKHINKNHISKFNNFDEMLFSLVERIITLSQIEPSYNFFLPFILTHIFTEFLTKTYEEEYISRKNHRRPNILFENREISFTSIARLTTNHHRSNTKYINNEQYYVKDSNPVVDFMEDAIYTFFNPSSFSTKTTSTMRHWKNMLLIHKQIG